jgi:hypothetical protein
MNAPKKIWKEHSHKVHAKNTDFVIETQKFEPTQYIRADLVDGLVEALNTAKDVFRVYQAHHEAKGDEKKSERNRFYAEQMEAALAKLEE